MTPPTALQAIISTVPENHMLNKHSRRSASLTFAAVVLSSALSHAGTITDLTSRAQVNGNDSIDWAAVETALGTAFPPNGFTYLTPGGITVTVTHPTGTFQFLNFGGLSGTDLDSYPSTVTLSFSSPVEAIGFNLQTDLSPVVQATYTGTLSGFSGASGGGTLFGSDSVPSIPALNIVFLGISSSQNDIRSITVAYSPFCCDPADEVTYAIDQVSLFVPGPAGAPEPGTIALALGGLIAIAFLRARRPNDLFEIAVRRAYGTQSSLGHPCQPLIPREHHRSFPPPSATAHSVNQRQR
jgi:hypothetical protein